MLIAVRKGCGYTGEEIALGLARTLIGPEEGVTPMQDEPEDHWNLGSGNNNWLHRLPEGDYRAVAAEGEEQGRYTFYWLSTRIPLSIDVRTALATVLAHRWGIAATRRVYTLEWLGSVPVAHRVER